MRVAKQDYETSTGGISESGKMTIAMNGFAFSSLINNLYANKIDSPLRELLTNARDGHAAIGKIDSPIQLHLPGQFDQTFWVRDFGCSMTHEFMTQDEGGYKSLFSSTKRDTDEQVGMLGLGRVSPLAYTDAYTVTCWTEGKQRDYSVYLGADGVPDVAFLGSRASSEPDGVKVSYPAKMEDIRRFKYAADKILLGFDGTVKVVNETYVDFPTEIYKKGSNWVVYNNFPLDAGLYARQGCVIYPVSKSFIRDNLPGMNQYLRLVVDFPIGQLNVATSREELSYDTLTTTNLKAGIEKAVTELADLVTTEISTAASYFEACTTWLKMKTGYQTTQEAVRILVGSRVSWGGLVLREHFKLKADGTHTAGMYFGADDSRPGNHIWHLSFRQKAQDVTLDVAQMSNLKVFVEHGDLTFGTARMKRVLAELCVEGDRILWMRPSEQLDLTNWLEQHGKISYTDLATVEPLKAPAGSGGPRAKTTAIKMRYIEAGTRRGSSAGAIYDVVIPTKDTVFMNQDGTSLYFTSDSRTSDLYSVETKLESLTVAGVIPHGTRIYFINGSNNKQIARAVPNPVMIYDYINKAVKTKFNTDTLRIPTSSYENERCSGLARKLNETGIPLWGSLKTFVDKYTTTNGQVYDRTEQSVLETWAPHCLVKSIDKDHEVARRTLYEEFDLLELIIDRSYRNEDKQLKSYLNLLLSAKGN